MEKVKKKEPSSSEWAADDDGEEKYRMWSAIAFMTVVIVIGVPMWWKTTEVYRVKLPSEDILSLSDQSIKTTVKIGIFTFERERAQLLIKELSDAFAGNSFWHITFEEIPAFDKVKEVHTPAALEALILKNYKLSFGDFIFIEWPKLQEEVLMTTDQSAFIRTDTSSKKLKNVINILILQTHRIQQILSTDHRNFTKSEAPRKEYDVIISVLNQQPELMDVKWNVQMAVEVYIESFLKEVSGISKFALRTQWKYQLPMGFDLKQVRDNSELGRHYALPESTLPHIITSFDKNLGVGITAKSAINLVVYVPPCTIAPIYLYNHQNEAVGLKNVGSFISPKWGGVIIANPPPEAIKNCSNTRERVQFNLNTNDIMQVMLKQLHKLLDISIDIPLDGVKVAALEQIAPRRWEYDAFIRRSVIQLISTSTNTLQSLIRLVDNISYIVINDAVGADILVAYENIQLAKASLASGDLLEATKFAKQAFDSSEHAFFDASLLAQLYFPDEQKYAIYIPLFLPIMVPVISSFGAIRKLVQKMRAVDKVKAD